MAQSTPDEQYMSRWKIRVIQNDEEIHTVFVPDTPMPPGLNRGRIPLGVAIARATGLAAQHPNTIVQVWEWYPMHSGEPLTPVTECGEEYLFFTIGKLH